MIKPSIIGIAHLSEDAWPNCECTYDFYIVIKEGVS